MPIAEIVNQWADEKLKCWPLAGHTEAYNQVVEALPDLIARLTPAPKAAKPAADAETTS